MKKYKLRVIPLTGIHIGTGNSVGPGEYTVIESIQETPIYLRVNQDAVIESLKGEDRQKFLMLLDKDNYRGIRKFMAEKANKKLSLYAGHMTRSFNAYYRKNIESENMLQVMEAYRPDGSKRPYIPGSSLKTIRTAILDFILQKEGGRAHEFEMLPRKPEDGTIFPENSSAI